MYIHSSFSSHLHFHSASTHISQTLTRIYHMKRKIALLYNNNNSCRLLKLIRFSFTTRSRMTIKSSSNADREDPQCTLVGDVGLDSLSLDQQHQSEETSTSESSTSQLESLSDDLLLNVLLYCGPNEVESNVKLVSRRLQ